MHEDVRTVVLFSGGGTGGHLYPALALAQEITRVRPDVRPFFVGSRRGLEARVLAERGIEHRLVEVSGLRRNRVWRNAAVLRALFGAVADLSALFRRIKPELVVVTGGYAGAPAGVVAALMSVPLVLQEQNSLPGITTRLLSRWARQIHLAYPEALDDLVSRARGRAIVGGNPVRPPVPIGRAKARAGFGLAPEGRLALVVGGSQGSAALNQLVAGSLIGAARGLFPRPNGLQILWASGPSHFDEMRTSVAELGSPEWLRLVPYIDDMPAALACADIALSRAGAMATSEFLAWGLPAVLVPLPTAAEDHQTRNAQSLAAAGTAIHMPEVDTSPHDLWSVLVELAEDDVRLSSMADAARARGRPDAATDIARAIADLLPPPRQPLRDRAGRR